MLIIFVIVFVVLVTAVIPSFSLENPAQSEVTLERVGRLNKKRNEECATVFVILKSQTPIHGHRLRKPATNTGYEHHQRTPPTDINLPHPNILTCRDVGLWHCDVANLL